MAEKYEIVRSIFRPDTKGGFDYRPALKADAKAQARLAIMTGAIDWVLTVQQADAAKETTFRRADTDQGASSTFWCFLALQTFCVCFATLTIIAHWARPACGQRRRK
jgi:hypothetical protein